MNLHNLYVFVVVAEQGKMNLAAKKLFMTESSVSQTISRLEHELNVTLFERLNKRIYLTYEGKELLTYAHKILAMEEQLEEYMKELSGSKMMNLGVSGSASFYVIHQVLARFNREMASDQITLYHYSNNHIRRLLRSGELDIAMTSIDMSKDEDIISYPVYSDKLALVCGKNHPLWQKDCIRPEELQSQPFIVRESMSGTRLAFERFLNENGILIRTKGISNNALYCKYAVQFNPYLTVISRKLCEEDVRAGTLHFIEIEGKELAQDFCLAYHKNKALTPMMNTFIRACTQYLQNGID